LSYLQHDPFAVKGVFADYELLEWIVEGVNPDLLTSDLPLGLSSAHVLTKRGIGTVQRLQRPIKPGMNASTASSRV